MLPLRDTIPSRTVPVVNYALIGANTLFFLFELVLGPDLEAFIHAYGFVPGRFFASFLYLFQVGPGPFLSECVTLLTSMFMHGGWMHFVGNMLFLYIFGDNVEDRLGHFRYLLFYLFTGVAAALIHGVFAMDSMVPTIGASGAISGVMGAYFRMFPHSRVLTLVPFFFFYQLVELPAFLYLAFWFILQFFQGTFAIIAGAAGGGGVAWMAHVGGFITGLVLAHRWERRHRHRVEILRDTDLWPFDL